MTSPAPHAQRFLAVHGIVLNLFRIGRHVLRAVNHRLLRARAFGAWHDLCLNQTTRTAHRWRRSLPAHHQLDSARASIDLANR